MVRRPDRSELVWSCVSFVLLAAAVTVLALVRRHVDAGTAALLLLAVPLVACAASMRVSVVVSVVSALAFNYVFTQPYNSLAIESSTSVAAFVVYVVLALVVSVTVGKLRAARADSVRHATEAVLVRDLTIDLVRQSVWLRPPVSSALDELVLQFEAIGATVSVAIDESERFSTSSGASERARAAADATMRMPEDERLDSAQPTLVSLRGPDADVRVFAIASGTRSYGVLAIELAPGHALDPSRERVAALFANVVAIACERAALQREAEQRRILEASDQLRVTLLRSVSHDLRTPLTTIRALASAPANLGPLTGEQRSVLDDIEREAARLARMVEQVLDLSRIEGGMLDLHLARVHLDELVRTAVEAVEPSLPDGVRIAVNIDPDVPAVPVDEPLIEQVLVNLLENAIHHGAPPIELSVRTRRERVEIAVADHGPGIPEAERRRLFEAGFAMRKRTPDARRRGLGLVVGAGFVEAHHGHLRAEPTPGGGATFVISLPQPVPRTTGSAARTDRA